MNTFLLEIITPERIAFSQEVEMVTAPSATGEIGILPKHVPLFTRLVEGEVKIKTQKDETYLAIGSGFLEITPKKTILLVTSAFHANEINEADMVKAKKSAQEALLSKPEGEALAAAEALIRRSEIALKVLRRHGKKSSVL